MVSQGNQSRRGDQENPPSHEHQHQHRIAGTASKYIRHAAPRRSSPRRTSQTDKTGRQVDRRPALSSSHIPCQPMPSTHPLSHPPTRPAANAAQPHPQRLTAPTDRSVPKLRVAPGNEKSAPCLALHCIWSFHLAWDGTRRQTEGERGQGQVRYISTRSREHPIKGRACLLLFSTIWRFGAGMR